MGVQGKKPFPVNVQVMAKKIGDIGFIIAGNSLLVLYLKNYSRPVTVIKGIHMMRISGSNKGITGTVMLKQVMPDPQNAWVAVGARVRRADLFVRLPAAAPWGCVALCRHGPIRLDF